jgi:hypothetical protein
VIAIGESSASSLHHGTNLDRAATGPSLGHRERLVQVGHLDLGVSADQLVALEERTVDDQRIACAQADRRGGLARLKLTRGLDRECSANQRPTCA